MSSFSRWQSRSAVLLALGIFSGAATPLLVPAPASAQQANFSDVGFSYWARPLIQKLASEGIIRGFPDGTFKPDAPVTRAQFAAIIRQAFNQGIVRSSGSFSDVPSSYWAASSINEAYTTGFMSGYPNGTFQPDLQIPVAQVLVSLASGLRLAPSGSTSNTLSVYSDASQIPSYATNGVAAATQKKIVVNYPNVKFLNPSETATRADVAAYIYQALVSQGQLPELASNVDVTKYIVGYSGQSGGGTGNNQNKLVLERARGACTNKAQSQGLQVYDVVSNKIRTIPGGLFADVTLLVGRPGQQGYNALCVFNNNQPGDVVIKTADGQTSYQVAQGTPIDVQYTGGNNIRIVVARGETLNNVTLEVAKDVRKQGNVLIPKGSRIVGDLRPVSVGSQVGTQFYARQLTIRDRTYNINATSGVVVTGQAAPRGGSEQTVASPTTRSTLGDILGNASLVGNIVGVLTGQKPTTTPNDANDFIYINPSTDLNLRVESAFNVSSAS